MTALVVMSAGPGLSIQDQGRFGWQKYGLGPSGAMDIIGLSAANLLVGNAPLTGALELPLAGAKFRVEGGDVYFAVSGAKTVVRIDGTPVPEHQTAIAHDGQVIEISTARAGVYMYLAVAGGFSIPQALGSQAYHARAKVGGIDGRAIQTGDHLALNALGGATQAPERSRAELPYGAGPFRVVLGPQQDHFTERGIETFLSAPFKLTPEADRMGFRLEGPGVEHSAKGYNIVSDGIITGSVQVPGSGHPIILLADRQTTGGYPKIATVISSDLPRLAHARPGSELRFKAVTREEAIAARRAMLDALDVFAKAKRPAAETELDVGRLLTHNLIDGVTDGNDQSHL
jgi:biotin-dependent carboxylase-like uncharacterized protein